MSVWHNKKEGFLKVSSMLTNRPKTKLLVDGGDPAETLRIKSLIGFVDGQTTNPSLIAKNPEIQRRLASGHKLSAQEEKDEYKKIVQSISPLVGDAGVSIEVFADLDSRAEEMLAQGQEMFTWIPNAYVEISVHPRGLASRTNVGAKGYSGQHDSVLFAGASRCRICRNQGIEGAGVCITVCRPARRSRRRRHGPCQKYRKREKPRPGAMVSERRPPESVQAEQLSTTGEKVFRRVNSPVTI